MLRTFILLGSIIASVACVLFPHARLYSDTRLPMLEELSKSVSVLSQSKDPRELEKELLWLCHSDEGKALEALSTFLEDVSFLSRLDTKEDYGSDFRHLRLTRVLVALAKCSPSQVQDVLLRLGKNKEFLSHYNRKSSLIYAAGFVSRPSSNLFQFLESQAFAGSGDTITLVEALVRIRTPEAMTLLEKMFVSKNHSTFQKSRWCTEFLAIARNDPAIVNLYDRLLKTDIKDEKLRNIMVQSLFEFRKWDWFGFLGAEEPKRDAATTPVLQEVLKLADYALKMDLTTDTKKSVTAARKAIEEILASRQPRK